MGKAAFIPPVTYVRLAGRACRQIVAEANGYIVRSEDDISSGDTIEPDLAQARRTAVMAHNVVVKLKEMGLPEGFDQELAALSTDLGDLWGAEKVLAERLEGFLGSPEDWEAVGDRLVDLRATIDHIGWHMKNVRRPMGKIARFAYRKASETGHSNTDTA